MDIEDTEGREIDEKPEIIFFDKHPTEYAMEAAHKAAGLIIHALHRLAISGSAKEVLLGYLDLSYQATRLPPGREMARRCGMSHSTYLKSKRELISVGIIYIGEKGSSFADYSSPERIHVRDFVVKFLDQAVVEKLDHGSVVQKLDHGDIVQGQDVSYAKATKDGMAFNVESFSSNLNASFNLNLQKESTGESDVPGDTTQTQARDEIDSAFDSDPFADPLTVNLKTEDGEEFLVTVDDEKISISPKRVLPFKLTPPPSLPSGSSKKPVTPSRKFQPSVQVNQDMLNRMIALCYGITTTQQWVTVDKTTLQRCSAAVGKLIQARANFSQWDEWESWWWSFAKGKPTPETVVRTWFKGVGDSSITHIKPAEDPKTAERVREDEAKLDARIKEGMLRRARKQ